MMATAGENLGRDPVHIRHEDLTRVSDNSPFRSWCPVCGKGILLVGRAGNLLKRVDRCTLCGQLVIYDGDEIAGEPLEPSVVFAAPPAKKTRWDRMLEDEDGG